MTILIFLVEVWNFSELFQIFLSDIIYIPSTPKYLWLFVQNLRIFRRIMVVWEPILCYGAKANSKCKSKKIYIASTITIAKFSQYYSEKNPTLQRKFRKIIAKFRYNIVDAIFAIVLRNFGEFFYGCILINFFYMEYFVNVIINSVLEIEEEEYIWM